ncbi:unnamed protein product [Brassica napus]|uniref:(rape) hypothetical protein n=1 Tax=Brassica napus TaxID=3708 RepID=A0A816N2D0_BRANA|nr:unnamed protein product [Brassica napus]
MCGQSMVEQSGIPSARKYTAKNTRTSTHCRLITKSVSFFLCIYIKIISMFVWSLITICRNQDSSFRDPSSNYRV